MDIQEIFSAELHRFPTGFKYKSLSSGDALLYVSGSVTANGTGMIGYNVNIDGKLVCQPTVWANEPGDSRTLVADVEMIKTPGLGEHTVEITAASPNTKLGKHDYICGTVFYRGSAEPFIWRPNGPLPQTMKFKSMMSGFALLFFGGSGYMKTPKMGGIAVTLNGTEVARTEMMPSIANSHFAFPSLFVPIKLQVKEYEIGLRATTPDLTTDNNDVFEIVVMY